MGLTIEDRLAVQDVIILYCHFHDSKQSHRVVDEIFTEDAQIDYGTGSIVGREAIAGFFGGFGERYDTSHVVTNLIVEGDGDWARCHSHVMAWHWLKRPEVNGRPSLHPVDTLIVAGSDDELRRSAAGWRITKRSLVQYGTGLGAGVIDEPLRLIMEGCLGRLPDWP